MRSGMRHHGRWSQFNHCPQLLKDLQRLGRPSYVPDKPWSSINASVLFSVVLAGLVMLAVMVVLSSLLSSTLWGPAEKLMEQRMQPVVIPPEFWTTMLDFHREMKQMRAAMAVK